MSKKQNALISETSPYLLQHAYNPVEWYAWGEEAFERAKNEDKPILVSIGYAACHWCHVMERESFENDETAAIMNEHFINIKVDREERPDVDHIYMDAVQAMAGNGGWPLNVFLTPKGKPFFGGTYFPPVRAYNRSSWKEVLAAVNKAYTERKSEIESQAENVTAHIQNSNAFGIGANNNNIQLGKDDLNTISANMMNAADKTWGGFGKAPKFPQTFTIQFLLRHYHFTKDENALQLALLSLDKMIYGGIYDQLGGGFARYSTDEQWLAPHFEKMLYDNALLVSVMAEAYQLTNKEVYAIAICETMQFIKRELWNEEGGFYSALDADSEGVEGKFYTWSKNEIDEILKDNSSLFCEFYNVVDEGNWEHTNILWITASLKEFAAKKSMDESTLKNILSDCKQQLMMHRNKRIRPALDDKILLGWNALMNTACCKAYAALGDEEYKQMAMQNIEFLFKKFSNADVYQWHHTYKNGITKYPAFLDDYAYTIQACIHLQEITGDQQFLLSAKEITQIVLDNFQDKSSEYFLFTHQLQTDIIVRKKEVYDGAVPSGNAVMAANLLYLSVVFDVPEWKEQSQKMIINLNNAIIRYPTSFGVWATNMQSLIYDRFEIALTGKQPNILHQQLLKKFIPNRVLQIADKPYENFPLLTGRYKDNMQIFVCKNYACQQPVKSIEELNDLLNNL